ncbi:MAG: class I SAM-dependent rRNA methyltransferase [Campylobacterota bacterium]|nr:class I SAM-dependent rRNA methyltransferase [Campylobacterota bacterium]
MNKTVDITIKEKYIKEYSEGYPLISLETIENIDSLDEEGFILDLYDNKKKFIAKAYYGRQNKGYGWTLTRKKEEKIDKEFFRVKIEQALKNRDSYIKDNETTAFRVFNGEGDGIGGLTIDYFGNTASSVVEGFYMITWYSLGIYRFKDKIVEALKSCVEYTGIYEKKRFDTKGQYLDDKGDFICGEEANKPIIVKENSIKFAVYLDDGPMVGVFLDQKNVRKTLRDKYSKGKTVLNTFSYTGAFSVAAALGGALKTTSVDLANRSRAKTKEQFEINGIDSAKQDIIVEDVFNYFKFAVKKAYKFDLVVLDPPSFARSKKHTFSVAKDYTKLLKEAITITNKNGIVVASTNAANVNMRKFREFIDKAFKQLNLRYEIKEVYTLPNDFKVNDKFKQGDYLKVVFIKRIG